jgi:4-carboxymuconolactone decarboxylase
MNRFAPISRENLSPAQAEVYNVINSGARGGVRGPFRVLLHSPELARRVEQLGLYTRFPVQGAGAVARAKHHPRRAALAGRL